MVSNSSSGGCGGGGGGRSSKKLKQKKIPQRGLGVEKLEKIRLEEQQKIGSSVRPLPSLLPFPQPSPIDPRSSSVSLFRPSTSIPISNLEHFYPPPPLPTTNSTTHYGHTFVNPMGGGGGGTPIGWLTSNVGGHGHFPSIWNSHELNHNGESNKLDAEFAVGPNLHCDPKLNWPSPLVMPRKQQYQQLSSMVTVSSTSSSGPNIQMEPPSNQSCYSNYPPPLWPDEEKMVGIKRPWPFSLENQSGPSSSYKFPPLKRSDESSLCGNGGGGIFNFELGSADFREGHTDSIALHINGVGSSSGLNPKKSVKENGALDGKFLTLGFPSTPSYSTTSKFKQSLVFPAPCCQELWEVNMASFQNVKGSIEDPSIHRDGSVQQPPFYNFFPPNGQQIGHLGAIKNDIMGETGDGVDLNLKL